MAKLSVKAIKDKLSDVLDPELNISIVDLGLVYDVSIHHNSVIILMTLTTIGCPLITAIEEEIKQKLKETGIEEKNIKVDLTFDPPWSIGMMTPRAKAMLGI